MKGKMIIAIAICALLVAFPEIAFSAGKATDEDAVAMVEMAGKLIEERGDLALPIINNPEGMYFDKEKALYVVVYNERIEIIAHPYRPDLIGVCLSHHSQSEKIVTTSLAQGGCWLEYTDRACYEDDVREIKTYGKRFSYDKKNYIVCASIYKDEN